MTSFILQSVSCLMASVDPSLLLVNLHGLFFLLTTNKKVYGLQTFISLYLSFSRSIIPSFPVNQDHTRAMAETFPDQAASFGRALSYSCDVGRQSGHAGVQELAGWWQERVREWLHSFAHSRSVSNLALLFPSASTFNLSSWHSSQYSCASQKTTIPLKRLLK